MMLTSTFFRLAVNLLLPLPIIMVLSPPARADVQIGATTKVVNTVYAALASAKQQTFWLRNGLDVFQDELVITAENSATHLAFKDATQLSIGPTAQVTLDRFVYDSTPGASGVAISFVKGAFRFWSGHSSKEAYKITTPTATISVRGTVFTVFIAENGSELISVESGTVYVSCRSTGATVAVNAGQSTYIPGLHRNPRTPTASPPNPQVALMDTLLR